ncbi:MAG TPA: ABC transporter substrate-binding protein [Mycobacteriales bacterium]|nr:ABC transporter substrate-binding protein [Mycobacteriales bacterium]
MRLRLSALIAVVLAVVSGCGGGSSPTSGPTVAIVISAPVSTTPWIASFERNGAELAVDEINEHGGAVINGVHTRLVVQVHDNHGSPSQAAAIARQAVDEHAAALIFDGVGAAAIAQVTDKAGLPAFDVFDGGQSIVDPERRPTIYRLAPADKYLTLRLADYLAARKPKIAIVADDTGYGADGRSSLASAFRRDEIAVVTASSVASTTTDVSTQVLAARRAGATSLVVWASAPIVAESIVAARSAGWQVPIWAGPAGEDPYVRQRLAAHPDWLSGVGFVSFRITAEVGPAPFAAYRKAYVAKFGEDDLGLKQDGKQVVQPPDWSMFSYDTVNLVAAALAKSGATGPPLQQTLAGHISIVGANGDERGYSATSREGVSPDDMYFAVFDGFVFKPVTDDLLSQNLPMVPQTR